MRKIRLIGILLFSAMLAGYTFIYHIVPQKEFSVLENRSLETRPEFRLSDLLNGDYQEHYETYLNDQMFQRDRWVSLAVTLERLAGKKEINGVYIGKDGYLLEKYDDSDLEDVQIEENIRILSSFLNDAAARYGKKRTTFLIIPDKAAALPDKLPAYANAGIEKDNSVLTALKSRLSEPEIVLDAGPILRDHQDEYIYYRTDHHWTTLGAWYAYRAWARHTGHPAKALEDFSRETIFDDFYGTTYNKVHIKVPADEVELFHHPAENGVVINADDGDLLSDSFYFPKEAAEGFNRYNVFFSKNTARIHIQTAADTDRCLLVVKDSFANCFLPFLAGDYKEILMIDCRYGKENVRDILAAHEEITDVLVMYNSRKFMQDTNLRALDEGAKKMDTFDADSFFDE